ncbi:ABC transporter [Pseudomonas fluorescens BRIP34879]|uniref:ABC transporter ATP-binding protein n=1 Tax=Pseudomonas poae TaxID=200451 RepID=UPI0002A7A1B1|nr:ABC transporter [Pseudomonas fluorescens BRIP34879]MBC3195504.1 ABC transporter ATP-binding protein [Pseudomonas poae]
MKVKILEKTIVRNFARKADVLKKIISSDVRSRFFYLLILVGVGALLSVGGPLLLKFSVDHLGDTSSENSHQSAAILVSAYVCVIWIDKVLKEYKAALYIRVEQGIQRTLINNALRAIMAFKLDLDSSVTTQSVHEELSNGLIGFRMLFSNYTMILIPVFFQFIVMLNVFFLVYGVAYLLIMVLAFSVYAILFFRSARNLQILQRKALAYRTCAGSKMTDALLNIEAVGAFSLENDVVSTVDDQMARAEKIWAELSTRRLFYGVAQISVIVVALAAVLGIAFIQVKDGDVTAGGLVLLIFYLASIVQPMESLSLAYKEVKQGEVLFSKLFKYMEFVKKPQSLPDIKLQDSSSPSLEFRKVSFRQSNRQLTLSNASFKIPGGSLTAIVGASGSGKTTVSRLLMRFYKPSSGEILINGFNVSSFSTESLRRLITWVPQNATLFDESVFFNVWVGNVDSSASEVRSAMEAAYASIFLMRFPEGSESYAGGRVGQLSGGERQRIAIARAYLRGSRVIVFDEATSALDTVNEKLFFSRLKSDFKALTRIIITHKLEAVVDAEQIIVMAGGEVVEVGTHVELLSQVGEYARLWNSRSGVKEELIT